ncbi:MAG: hypothetical protein IJT04_00445 [Bacteroidales bacterium]|nr:hypothetical protein [Bacteroidales bacterium]
MKKNPVKKAFLASDILVIAAIIAAGVAIILLCYNWREFGYAIIACGLMMVPLYLHGYKIEGHSGIFYLEEIPISRESKEVVLSFLNGETDELSITPSESGGALLSLYTHKSGGEILAQYFDYDNVMAGNDMPIVVITSVQYEKLKRLCTKK